ncbi:DUF1257 domain-containing protein [Gloeobacter morelensis]|uniref:DUF1257 domain-containing protein n=1 Tax=Gloeobacter morelensis MG652769 TaxID=2781736 RepID=A0ABY3PKR4_9CYAN|nr:DUF1257 domain-containing protein [Gloeobacter morelensis]UFP94261.1 DUF1257 domain-containing protein [Gloeobacter morelensis MG652769]
MGHFSTLRTTLTDGKLIAATFQDMGFEVLTGKHAYVRGYEGQRAHAEVVCVLNGNYDLGFLPNENGCYDLIGDLWGISIKYNQTDLICGIFKRYTIISAMKPCENRPQRLLAANYDTWLRTEHTDTALLGQRLQEIGFSPLGTRKPVPYLEGSARAKLAVERRTPPESFVDRSTILHWVRNQQGSLDLNISRGWQHQSVLAELLNEFVFF